MRATPVRARLLPVLLGVMMIGQASAATPLGGDFTLPRAGGKVSLAALRGKVVPVYFGYMSCPDLCPTTLGSLGAALRLLDDTDREQVQALFISLDPERDDVQRLAEYAHFFHPTIIGTTGPPDVLEDIARRYRVTVSQVAGDEKGQYTLDHTSRLILIGRGGKMQGLLADGTPAEEIAAAIRELLLR